MSGAFIDIVKFVFVDLWRFFTGFHIPGTSISFAEWAVFSLVVVRVIQFIRTVFGIVSGDLEDDDDKGNSRRRKGR